MKNNVIRDLIIIGKISNTKNIHVSDLPNVRIINKYQMDRASIYYIFFSKSFLHNFHMAGRSNY